MSYWIGERLEGTVSRYGKATLYLTLPEGRFGGILLSEFDQPLAQIKSKYPVGKKMRVVITQIKGKKITLSYQRVDDPELQDPRNQFNGTSPENFFQVLHQTAVEADETIRDLKKLLDQKPQIR